MFQLVLNRSIPANRWLHLRSSSPYRAQVAFLNFVVLFFFYNFYVCFNLNYIVVTHWCFGDDYFSSKLVIVSEKDIAGMLFFFVGSSIYCSKHWSCANCRKAFAWTWFLCVPPSAICICQSIIGKFRSPVNINYSNIMFLHVYQLIFNTWVRVCNQCICVICCSASSDSVASI